MLRLPTIADSFQPASYRSRCLLKGPVIVHAVRVDEALPVLHVRIKVVQADKLVPVDATVTGDPLTAEKLPDQADGLQGEVHHFVEQVADVGWMRKDKSLFRLFVDSLEVTLLRSSASY